MLGVLEETPIVTPTNHCKPRSVAWSSIGVNQSIISQSSPFQMVFYQRPCNRNRLIGGTYHIQGLFFRPRFQGIYPQNMAWKMVRTYLHWPWNDHWFQGQSHGWELDWIPIGYCKKCKIMRYLRRKWGKIPGSWICKVSWFVSCIWFAHLIRDLWPASMGLVQQ